MLFIRINPFRHPSFTHIINKWINDTQKHAQKKKRAKNNKRTQFVVLCGIVSEISNNSFPTMIIISAKNMSTLLV